MNNYTNKVTYLPPAIIKDVAALKLTKRNQQHLIYFIELLKLHSFEQFENYTSFTLKASDYLLKVFNTKYTQWLRPAIDKGIVIVQKSYDSENDVYKETYDVNKGIAKHYALNSDYYKEFDYKDLVRYNYSGSSSVKVSNSPSLSCLFTLFENWAIDDLKKLNIDYPKLYSLTDDLITKHSIHSYKVNDQITENSFRVTTTNSAKAYSYPTTKDNAIAKAKKENKILIQDGRKFFICDEEKFINDKKQAMEMAYISSIKKMENCDWYAGRNNTNSRLDTNITNMPGVLVDQICKINGLVQIDLKNSQFAILAHVLRATPGVMHTADFKHFESVATNGTLYEDVQEFLGLQTRTDAKELMFQIFFSKETYNTSLKANLKKRFPNVIKWIDDYKKHYGSESFSIMLQKKESEIFIDNIYQDIKAKGLFCLTKHDSIIVRKEDYDVIYNQMKAYFDSIGMQGVLETTDYSDATVEDEQPIILLRKKPCPFMAEFKPVALPVIQIPDSEIEAAEIAPIATVHVYASEQEQEAFEREVITLVVTLLINSDINPEGNYGEKVLGYFGDSLAEKKYNPGNWNTDKMITILANKFSAHKAA